MNSNLTVPTPVYVTRKTADGHTASLSIPMWLFLLIGLMVVFNILVWSAIGLGEAIRFII